MIYTLFDSLISIYEFEIYFYKVGVSITLSHHIKGLKDYVKVNFFSILSHDFIFFTRVKPQGFILLK